MEPLDIDLEEGELELPAEPMHLNMGPSHPAMHGTVRIVLELSGETIVKADVQIGYLHRGFEKMCERGTWAQVFPYVDRLNYVSPMLNNVGYALAVEKLCGIAVPERCQWYRMALGELARISDHLTCNGAMAMELGAFTPFLWFVKAREMVWDILEEETGARLTHSFGRIGGMAKPPTADFKEHVPRRRCRRSSSSSKRARRCSSRTASSSTASRTSARSAARTPSALGWTGPCLRSTGVAYDVRKAHPYLKYDEVDFDVPVGTKRRHARSLPRAPRRDPPVQAHHRAVARAHGRRRARSTATTRASCSPRRRTSTRPSKARSSTSSSIMEGAKVPAGEVTRTPRAATASSATTSSRTAAARRTACASARRASRSPAAFTASSRAGC